MSYRILVLPDRETIDLDVLRKVAELVNAGATVVGPKPSRATGLRDYPHCDDVVQKLAAALWVPATARRSASTAMARGGSSAASRPASSCGWPA